jgi:peptidoglycan/LPS O-acetylase OafA/YrhL
LEPDPPVTGNTEHTEPSNRTFFPALDGLRAVAFLLVFLEHTAHLPWGWSGVNVFFVLSGFLITGILWDTRDQPHRTRNFYVRRTLRIFPLYYGIFLALLVTTPLMHWQWSPAWIAWPLYAGNFLRFVGHGGLTSARQIVADAQLHSPIHGIILYMGHFWSLCVEEQFYLFWPWIVFWAAARRRLVLLSTLAVFLTPAIRLIVHHYAPGWMLSEELLYRLLPFQLDSLLLGALLSLLWRGGRRDLLQRVSAIVALIITPLIVAYFIWQAHVYVNLRWGYVYPAWAHTWGLSLINVYAASLMICALRPGSIVYRVLHLRPLRQLGRISYGAYVYHSILHGIIEKYVYYVGDSSAFILKHHGIIALVLAFIATVVISWLSYKYFETPFLNLKERWAPANPSIGSKAFAEA